MKNGEDIQEWEGEVGWFRVIPWDMTCFEGVGERQEGVEERDEVGVRDHGDANGQDGVRWTGATEGDDGRNGDE
jgi:hypothetical protein